MTHTRSSEWEVHDESQHGIATHTQLALQRRETHFGRRARQLIEEHVGGRQRAVPAQRYFHSRREPAQLVAARLAILVRPTKARLRQVHLSSDAQELRVMELVTPFVNTHGRGIATKRAGSKRVDYENALPFGRIVNVRHRREAGMRPNTWSTRNG